VQFTGRDNDGTGLCYYRARYYDPWLQRFATEDPIGFTGGDVNLHSYVRNSPTGQTDPLGLCLPVCAAPLIPPAVAALGEAAAWTGATLAAGALGEWLSNKLASTPGGDDPAFESEEARRRAIEEAQRVLKDPDASQRDKSKAKRRMEEL